MPFRNRAFILLLVLAMIVPAVGTLVSYSSTPGSTFAPAFASEPASVSPSAPAMATERVHTDARSPPAGTRSVVELYNEDFESGTSNWETSTQDPWGLTTSSSHSSTHSFTDSPSGDYDEVVNSYIAMTTDVSLADVEEPKLSFWHRMNVEGTSSSWDGGIVEVSTNGGSTWQQLDSTNSQGKYDTVISSGFSNPLAGKYGFTYDRSSWQEVEFDIAQYNGETTFRVRFRFGSDDYDASGQDGWYIDDVVIKDTAVNFPPLAPTFVATGTYDVGIADTGVTEDPVRLSWACNDNDGDTIKSYWLNVGTQTGMNSDAAVPDVFGGFINGTPAATFQDIDVDDGVTYHWSIKAYDGKLWGPWSPEFSFTTNIRPNATIDGITDDQGRPVTQSFDGAEVFFYGNGTDPDGSIVDYKWESSADGFLSDQPSFSTTALSINSHVIKFSVKDDAGEWSVRIEIALQVGHNDPPTIDTFVPSTDTITINSGEIIDFSVTASDPQVDVSELYIDWYLGGQPDPIWSGLEFRFISDQYTVGDHSLRVVVSDGNLDDNYAWSIHINGAPVITVRTPSTSTLTMPENATMSFDVTADDPNNDDLEYDWFVNGDKDTDASGEGMDEYTFATDFDASIFSPYRLLCRVSDDGGMTAQVEWNITVTNVIRQMELLDWDPYYHEVTIDETQHQAFSVEAASPDTAEQFNWYVDSRMVGAGPLYSFQADFDSPYNSSGIYTVKVIVTDENPLTADLEHSWQLTVQNVNRYPVAIIDRPTGYAFGLNEPIVFDASSSYDPDGDQLTYSWTDDAGIEIGSDAIFTTELEPGTRTIVLTVHDTYSARDIEGITLHIDAPRLELADFNVMPIAPEEGDTVRVTMVVRNTGTIAAEDVKVTFVFGNETNSEIVTVPAQGRANVSATWEAKPMNDEQTLATLRVEVEYTADDVLLTKNYMLPVEAAQKESTDGDGAQINWLILIAILGVLVFDIIIGLKYKGIILSKQPKKSG